MPEKAERLYQSDDHIANFFDCVRSRKLPIADVEIGHRSASACHVGVIALCTGLKLSWDGQREEFTGENAREDNRYVQREMRKPLRLQLRVKHLDFCNRDAAFAW